MVTAIEPSQAVGNVTAALKANATEIRRRGLHELGQDTKAAQAIQRAMREELENVDAMLLPQDGDDAAAEEPPPAPPPAVEARRVPAEVISENLKQAYNQFC